MILWPWLSSPEGNLDKDNAFAGLDALPVLKFISTTRMEVVVPRNSYETFRRHSFLISTLESTNAIPAPTLHFIYITTIQQVQAALAMVLVDPLQFIFPHKVSWVDDVRLLKYVYF